MPPTDTIAFGLAFVLINACIKCEHTDSPGVIDMELFNLKIHVNMKLIQLVAGL